MHPHRQKRVQDKYQNNQNNIALGSGLIGYGGSDHYDSFGHDPDREAAAHYEGSYAPQNEEDEFEAKNIPFNPNYPKSKYLKSLS